jgi:hypothetical protein
MDTMKNPIFSRSRMLTAIVVCGFLLAVIYWLLRTPVTDILHDASTQTSETLQPVMTQPKSTATVMVNQRTSDVAPVSGATLNTFFPGVRHKVRRYNGSLNEKGLVPSTVPGWWLYAYSEEEAAWLDKHGYPTPAEALRLRNSTKQELKQLYDLGDINALAHLAARSTVDVMNNNPNAPRDPYGRFDVDVLTMPRLSPYQAIVLVEGYMEAKAAFYQLPIADRTEDQRNFLRVRVNNAEFALALAQALGEATLPAISAADGWTGMNPPGDYSDRRLPADSFADSLFKVHQARIAAGLPPLDFQKRPTPLDTTQRRPAPTQVLERY